MAKRALITGACGFTGSNMLEYLSDKGWEIVATDLEKSQREIYYNEEGDAAPVYFEDIINKVNVKFIPADLTRKESLEPLFEYEYDVIFHIASLFDYFATWEDLYKVNVEGGRNIAELAMKHKVPHFIHWSTEGVLGDAGFDKPKCEEDEYNPHNRYCRSKVEQEKLLWELYREEGFPVTIIRPAPIYGPGHKYGVYNIFLRLRKLGKGIIPRIYPRKNQLVFPSVHVFDLLRAAVFLHEKKEESIGEAYNILSDTIGQDELLEFLADYLGMEKKTRLIVPWVCYKSAAKLVQRIAPRAEEKARKKGVRPKLDAAATQYLTGNMWFSNQKIKDLGFEFIYPDPRRGLWDYITWCKEKGLI